MFTHASWRRGFAASALLGLVTAPLAVGFTAAPVQASTAAATGPVDVQILATNDFHGRIQNDTTSASAGAAVLAGAVKQLRGVNPNTVFAAAGDLIGASTFESFIAKDKPTIDALNEAGLEVSAVGNHEFDQGYNDLVNRVMAPYNADTNPYGGATWKYLGANVKFKDSGDPALDGTWIKDMGGVQVGFVGAVTEHLPELVSPGGISNIDVTDIATAANTAADDLKSAGADVVVLLVHEGAASTDCATITSDTTSDFGRITSAVNDNVDAIVSGHTHLSYNCSQPVAGWAGRPITTRPIVSAGQYGMNLNQLTFTVDPDSGTIQNKTQALLPLKQGTTGSTFNYPVDSATQTIVTNAVNNANVLGAQPLGNIAGAFQRAKLANGTTENRGGESTLGNMVAEIQKWATTDPAFGAAQIAFMNPGGLRADLVGQGTGAFPRVVTYKDAANVQPFANTLVNEDLTGAQIKAALEQQWQPAGASRPFLKLGISRGFTYTYDPATAQGSRIKSMFLDGTPIDLNQTYSVTVNSFLATGGDNFTALGQGTGKQDTGRTDLQAQVDYFAANASGTALAVDYTQRGVGGVVTTATPQAGQDLTVNLSSLSMTGPGDLRDTTVTASINGTALGSFPVTTTIQTATPGFDEVGTSTVVVTLPRNLAGGAHHLVITGNNTSTTAKIPFTSQAAPTVDVQILATNDFHGRIQNDTTSASAGAAVLAGAVKQLRGVNPNTVFAAAGDLIGASTFESFIAKDKPTIDALNEAGLEVSAVGNHEFDQGYNDLVNRVMAPYDAQTNPYGGATWKYLGANVKFKDSGDPALDGTWLKDMGGVQVGFIGAVTEHLPELVSPSGISTLKVTDIVAATNAAADDLKAVGADVVVLLVHEGAASTSCATITSDTTSDFGKITSGVNDNIDAIVSGHTHLSYNCAQTVPGWSARPTTTRPIVSAGQYGMNLNQLNYTVDPDSGVIQSKTQAVLPLKNGTTGSTFNYPVDSATAAIVSSAVSNANVLGAQPLGSIGGAFYRAKLQDGTTENRGGESTLGNMVAEIQKWATTDPAFGAAQIAFMNPGGLRADLVGQGTGAFPRVVTYKDAANVQPFANTLVNEDLTGAQIKAALEQQWQPAGASRPFLKLGISRGFTYTYDPTAAQGSRIRSMFLDGTPIDLNQTYSVTVNSFLATGGDNFTALGQGTGKQDTGRTDLQAQVDYFAANASGTALAVDYTQRGVGGVVTTATPQAGQDLTVNLSSLSMTGPGDLRDATVTASINGTALGSFPVTTVIQSSNPGYDEAGTSTVVVTLPRNLAGGDHELVITGNQTGTTAKVPFTSAALPSEATTVSGTADPIIYGTDGTVSVTVTPSDATGRVELRDGATLLGTGTVSSGTASITLPGTALPVGSHDLTLSYLGDTGFDPSTSTVTVTVAKAATTVTGTGTQITYGHAGAVEVGVTSSGGTPPGDVELRDGSTVVGTVTLADGEGAITVPAGALAVGQHTLTLAYLGTSSFEPSTGSVTVTVVPVATTISGAAGSMVYGTDANITVTAAPSTATGTVELRDGARLLGTGTLIGGTASITVGGTALAVGSHDLALRFTGGTGYAPADGTVSIKVTRATPVVAVIAAPSTVEVKSGHEMTVRVSAAGFTPTGVVQVLHGTTVVGRGTLSAGVASIDVRPYSHTGTFGLTVDYLGDDATTTGSGSVSVRVVKQTPGMKVTAPDTVKRKHAPTVKVVLSGVSPQVRSEVTFRYDGRTVTRYAVDGKVRLTLAKLMATTRITVKYAGNDNFHAVTRRVRITVEK